MLHSKTDQQTTHPHNWRYVLECNSARTNFNKPTTILEIVSSPTRGTKPKQWSGPGLVRLRVHLDGRAHPPAHSGRLHLTASAWLEGIWISLACSKQTSLLPDPNPSAKCAANLSSYRSSGHSANLPTSLPTYVRNSLNLRPPGLRTKLPNSLPACANALLPNLPTYLSAFAPAEHSTGRSPNRPCAPNLGAQAA